MVAKYTAISELNLDAVWDGLESSKEHISWRGPSEFGARTGMG
jgi:hypothetical protein